MQGIIDQARKDARNATNRKRYKSANRFLLALKSSRGNAKAHGYERCRATPEELEDAFTGRCDICGVREEDASGGRLAMDHSHQTGKFRGFLCKRCNLMFSFAGDDMVTLWGAVDYLAKEALSDNASEISKFSS